MLVRTMLQDSASHATSCSASHLVLAVVSGGTRRFILAVKPALPVEHALGGHKEQPGAVSFAQPDDGCRGGHVNRRGALRIPLRRADIRDGGQVDYQVRPRLLEQPL